MIKKIFILCIFIFHTINLFSQVNSFFGGTLNVIGSSGSSPKYTLVGFFNDTSGEYPLDSVTVGDILYVSEGSICVRLRIDTINSSAGGILDADVFDVDTILVSPPSGIGALIRETPNSSLPRYIPGLSETLLSCIRTHMTGKIDQDIANAGDGNGIIDALPTGDVSIDAGNNRFTLSNIDQFNVFGPNGEALYINDDYFEAYIQASPLGARAGLFLTDAYAELYRGTDGTVNKMSLRLNSDNALQVYGNNAGSNWVYSFPKSSPSTNQIMYWPTPNTPAFTDLPVEKWLGTELPASTVDIDAGGNELYLQNVGQFYVSSQGSAFANATIYVETPAGAYGQIQEIPGSGWRMANYDASGHGIEIEGDEAQQAINMAGVNGGGSWVYYFPATNPSATLNDTTVMAWRGTGSGASPVGFVPYNSGDGDGNGIISALPSGPVTIDANNNALIIDSTSTTRITAVNTAQGDLVVSGNTSLPTSLSHISGVDTSQINVQGTSGIDLVTTQSVDIQSNSLIFNDLNMISSGTSTLLQHNGAGNLELYSYDLTPSDPFGLRIEHESPTIRQLALGDYRLDFNGMELVIDDDAGTVFLGERGDFGLYSTGSVLQLGDPAYNRNGVTFELNNSAQTILFGDYNENNTGTLFEMDLPASLLRMGDINILNSGLMYEHDDDAFTIKIGDATGVVDGNMFYTSASSGLIGIGDVLNTVTGFQISLTPSAGDLNLGDLNNNSNGHGLEIDATAGTMRIGNIYETGIGAQLADLKITDRFEYIVYDSPDSTNFLVDLDGITFFTYNDISSQQTDVAFNPDDVVITVTDYDGGLASMSLASNIFAVISPESYITWGTPQNLVSNPVDTMNNGFWSARTQTLMGYSGGSNWSFLSTNQTEAKMVYKALDNGNSNAIIKVGADEATMRINNETTGALLTQYTLSNNGFSLNFDAFSVFSGSTTDSLLYMYEDKYAFANETPSNIQGAINYMSWTGNGTSTDAEFRNAGEVMLGDFQAEVSTNTTLGQLNVFLPVDVSSGIVEIDLPAGTPNTGDIITVCDSRGNAATFNITIDFITAGDNLHGTSQNYIMNADNDTKTFVYINSTIGWITKN